MITSTNECFYFVYFNNNSASDGWAADVSSTATVPLTLNDFKARPNDEAIHLDWLTTLEVDVDKFIIQRRAGLSPDFKDLAEQSACGNCLDENRYGYVDKAVQSGVNYTFLTLLY